MKLVHLYLIGVFVMIVFLVGSTMWQFGQFQGNMKNMQFGLPQELTQSVPDANQQIAEMMAQMQTQMQSGAPAATEGEPAAAETKTWTAPDESFSFEYPADWIAMPLDQPVESAAGKILFSAYKTGEYSYSPSYLIIGEKSDTTIENIIEESKKNIWNKNNQTKISEYQTINSQSQIIKVLEFEDSTEGLIAGTTFTSQIKIAFAPDNGKIYSIMAIINQNDLQIFQEIDNVLQSLKIAQENKKSSHE